MPRPAEDGRDADAAFPHRSLPVEQRRVARYPLTAVVLHVDDERVAIETALLQRLQNPADPLVGSLENGDVILPCGGVVFLRLHESRVAGGDRWMIGDLE